MEKACVAQLTDIFTQLIQLTASIQLRMTDMILILSWSRIEIPNRFLQLFRDFPLLILFVSHLPLVEVEINSLGNSLGNLFPDIALTTDTDTNHFHCFSSSQFSKLFHK
jgi:hypothetical protein